MGIGRSVGFVAKTFWGKLGVLLVAYYAAFKRISILFIISTMTQFPKAKSRLDNPDSALDIACKVKAIRLLFFQPAMIQQNYGADIANASGIPFPEHTAEPSDRLLCDQHLHRVRKAFPPTHDS